MGKAQIIRRIHDAATKYKEYLVGNTYMFAYENQYVEVVFKKSSFLHLTGVDTNLSAEDFYKHALIKKGLRPQEVLFTANNPYDLADRKTQYLGDLYKVVTGGVSVATNVDTATFKYSVGLTDLKVVICLGDDTDYSGKLMSMCKIPYSFRIEDIGDLKHDDLYSVTHVLKKRTGTRLYTEVVFGNVDTIKDLPVEIRDRISVV